MGVLAWEPKRACVTAHTAKNAGEARSDPTGCRGSEAKSSISEIGAEDVKISPGARRLSVSLKRTVDDEEPEGLTLGMRIARGIIYITPYI